MSFNPVFYVTQIAQIANIISKCSVWDTACVTSLAQTHSTQIIRNGIDSETGPLDPMSLRTIEIDDGSFRFTCSDLKVLGLTDSIVETVQFNTQDRTFRMRSRVPHLSVLGNYTSAGFVDDVPYFGKGKILAVHNDFVNDLIIKYNVSAGKDGKNYFDLENYTYWFETPNSSIDFDGMNTDDVSKACRAREHSNLRITKLWQQFGRNFFDKFNQSIFEALQKFFQTKSVDDLLTDY